MGGGYERACIGAKDEPYHWYAHIRHPSLFHRDSLTSSRASRYLIRGLQGQGFRIKVEWGDYVCIRQTSDFEGIEEVWSGVLVLGLDDDEECPPSRLCSFGCLFASPYLMLFTLLCKTFFETHSATRYVGIRLPSRELAAVPIVAV